MLRRLLLAAVCVPTVLALAPASAPAEARSCGILARPKTETSYRLIALRGVSCKTARHVARLAATGASPAPWRCKAGTGATYRGQRIGSVCGRGGQGRLLRRPHAFLTVVVRRMT